MMAERQRVSMVPTIVGAVIGSLAFCALARSTEGALPGGAIGGAIGGALGGVIATLLYVAFSRHRKP